MDSTPFEVLEPPTPDHGVLARIPIHPPPRPACRLEPIRHVLRVLTAPDGTEHRVRVPVYPEATSDTLFAPPARRGYGERVRG